MNRDYFSYVPASPTVKAPSLPSVTPKSFTTPPATMGGFGKGTPDKLTKIDTDTVPEIPTVGPSTSSVFSPDSAARHSSKIVRQTSAMRKQVGAGDLATSSINLSDGIGGAYYYPTARTPSIPRMDTWRGHFSGSESSYDLRAHHGIPMVNSPDVVKGESIELHEAVLICIAKSIGLANPAETQPDSMGRTSKATSVSAVSTPNSPMFPPNTRSSRSPFGNVLDMMNASTQNDSMIGGMIREAVMNAQGDDEMSSVSASLQDSMMGSQDINKGVLRDLEGNVEILFFKQGSTLVKEGEKSPGIYYVIDGFLDVSITREGRADDLGVDASPSIWI